MAAIELSRPVAQVRDFLDEARRQAQTLLESSPNGRTGIATFRDQYLAWESRTSAVLEGSFKVTGFMTSSPKDEFNSTAISLLDLKIAATTIPPGRISEVMTDIREKIRVLNSIDGRLDVYESQVPIAARHAPSVDAPIFVTSQVVCGLGSHGCPAASWVSAW